jgi:hypothetical protein
MDPINYSIDVASPVAAAAQGYQLGAGIRDDQAKQQALQLAQQQQQQQAKVIQSLITNPNAGASDYANAALLVPGLREQLKQAWDTRNTDQQQSHLNDVGQYFAAVKSGRPDIAAQMMTRRADAMEASNGNPADIKALRTQAEAVTAHPEFARTYLGMMLSSLPGGDKVISSATALGTDQRAEAEAPAKLATAQAEARIKGAEASVAPTKVATDIANVQSQIKDRSSRLGLDRDKLTSDVQLELEKMRQKNGELPEFVAKDISSAATDAISAQQSASRMTSLADQIDKAAGELGAGVEAKTGELWKKTFGSQNDLSRIRAEYNRIVTPAAMAVYKQVASGSTSDKDIETAMTGVPKDTDSPERMSQFLRGAAKLQVYDSVLSNAKSEWLGSVRSLAKAPKDIDIDGVRVPAGTTFKAFADQYVAKKVAEQTAVSTLQNRGYMRFADPATSGASGSY